MPSKERSLPKKRQKSIINKAYHLLYKVYGPRHWWPADTSFEVAVGAILTQNTGWSNVEKAISNLKKERLLSPKRLYNLKPKRLARLIRPCGYFNIKTARLKSFLDFLFKKYKGDISRMRGIGTDKLRQELLGVNGIGQETADSILLYALDRPSFVIDAYTRRLTNCFGLTKDKATYEQVQLLFTEHLPRNRRLFNEFHALIVEHGKSICRPRPLCERCVLRSFKRR